MHVHVWDSTGGEEVVCACGAHRVPRAAVADARAESMREAVDDAEAALLRQDGVPVTVASIARWGGWGL